METDPNLLKFYPIFQLLAKSFSQVMMEDQVDKLWKWIQNWCLILLSKTGQEGFLKSDPRTLRPMLFYSFGGSCFACNKSRKAQGISLEAVINQVSLLDQSVAFLKVHMNFLIFTGLSVN